MKEYIFGERNGIYIIDLQKTLKMFKEASKFVQTWRMTDASCLFVAPSARRRTRLPKKRKSVECSTSTSAGWGTAHQLGHVQSR